MQAAEAKGGVAHLSVEPVISVRLSTPFSQEPVARKSNYGNNLGIILDGWECYCATYKAFTSSWYCPNTIAIDWRKGEVRKEWFSGFIVLFVFWFVRVRLCVWRETMVLSWLSYLWQFLWSEKKTLLLCYCLESAINVIAKARMLSLTQDCAVLLSLRPLPGDSSWG